MAGEKLSSSFYRKRKRASDSSWTIPQNSKTDADEITDKPLNPDPEKRIRYRNLHLELQDAQKKSPDDEETTLQDGYRFRYKTITNSVNAAI